MLNTLMAHLAVRYQELKENEEGQGLIEYALIAVLISIVAIVALEIVGVDVKDIFTQIETKLDGTSGS